MPMRGVVENAEADWERVGMMKKDGAIWRGLCREWDRLVAGRMGVL